MKANTRSVTGAVLMLAIIPVIVGLLACMPVPVGDPERSRVDDELNGIWVLTEDGKIDGYYLFRPWDKRTWLVLGVGHEGDEVEPVAVYKAWLKKLGGETFMSWEMAGGMQDDGSFLPDYWLVFRVEKDGARTVNLHMLEMEYDGFEDFPSPEGYDGNYAKDMRRKFERVIRKNVDDAGLYGDSLQLRRLADGDRDDALDRFDSYFAFE